MGIWDDLRTQNWQHIGLALFASLGDWRCGLTGFHHKLEGSRLAWMHTVRQQFLWCPVFCLCTTTNQHPNKNREFKCFESCASFMYHRRLCFWDMESVSCKLYLKCISQFSNINCFYSDGGSGCFGRRLWTLLWHQPCPCSHIPVGRKRTQFQVLLLPPGFAKWVWHLR